VQEWYWPRNATLTSAVTDESNVIPFRLRVGVTGHRTLSDVHQLELSVASVLDQVADRFPADRTPVVCRVVSPLAEGADRLVARTVLERPGADLIVPLPFARERLMKDFATQESKAEFDELYKRAVFHRVTIGTGQLSDDERHERVGHDVVDHADVLIALWDGLPSRGVGGTASIVHYARGGSLEPAPPVSAATRLTRWLRDDPDDPDARRIPTFVVRTDRRGAVETYFDERDWEGVRAAYRELDHFNRFEPAKRAFRRDIPRNLAELRAPLDSLRDGSRNPSELARFKAITASLEAWVLPAFGRADTGATSSRNQVATIGVGTALLAAAAVSSAAARVVLVPHTSSLTWAEVAFVSAVLGSRIFVMRQHAHTRWVSFRALAEMLRVMPYIVLAHRGASAIDVGRSRTADGVRPPTVQMEWFRRAVEEVWKRRPTIRLDAADLPWFRALIVARWIGGQISYHKRRSHQHQTWHRLLRGGVLVAFTATFVCALLDALDHGNEITVFLSIALPALGGALSYIEGHQEHGRHAERYRWTLSQLDDLQRRGERAQHINELAAVARDMLQLMDIENADWADVMWVRDIELSV